MPPKPPRLDLTALAGATIALDLDGTLADTAPDLVGTLNSLLANEGLASLPLQACRTMIGQGARALIARGFAAAGEPLGEDRMAILFDRFIETYRGRIADESVLFPGVLAALDLMKDAGARLAVCTNKPTDLSTALLQALGAAGRFDAIVGADAVSRPKPAAEHLIAAVQAAGGALDRAVMVGDSASDAGAARAAGAPLILVSFGYTEEPAGQLGADILIDHFDALPAACARLLRRPAGRGGEAVAVRV